MKPKPLFRGLLLSFVPLLFVAKVNAQGAPPLPQVIPPSPNVAAIQKYGEIPVSPYTGVPNPGTSEKQYKASCYCKLPYFKI
jgi:hypothetical protein